VPSSETDHKPAAGAAAVFLTVIGEPTHHSKFVAFQTPSSPIMEGIIDLHHDIMFFLVFVIVFVLYLMVVIIGTTVDHEKFRIGLYEREGSEYYDDEGNEIIGKHELRDDHMSDVIIGVPSHNTGLEII